jgi:SOS-response transcriptional repressor LexA
MPEEDIAARLAKLVEIAGSQAKFAKIVGKTAPAVHGWLHGSVPYPDTLKSIAQRCGVDLEWLRTGEGYEETELDNFRRLLERGGPPRRLVGRLTEEPGTYGNTNTTGGLVLRKIPVVSWAQAGPTLTAYCDVDDYEGLETFAVKDSRAVAVRISGDSMSPDYKPGTVAILYPSYPPRSENLVIAKLTDGSVLFKRLHIVGDKYHLISANPKYETRIVDPAEVERMVTVGKTERDEL